MAGIRDSSTGYNMVNSLVVVVAKLVVVTATVSVQPAFRAVVRHRLPPPTLQQIEAPTLPDQELAAAQMVCARGVCVLPDEEVAPEFCQLDEDGQVNCEPNADAPQPGFSYAFLWPRGLLLFSSVLYGTNFPLGRVMNEALPASAATSARMLFAAVALSPFLLQLSPSLRRTGVLCGCFTALGYVTQSLALVDTPAATVAFLGALTVVVCPALAVMVDGKQLGLIEAPQVWLAAALALLGVGVLELGSDGLGGLSMGDVYSVLQAVGFGTSFFITERMMTKDPTQALPITATQCAVAALVSGAWALADGTGVLSGALLDGQPSGGAWLLDEATRNSYALPGLLFADGFRPVCYAALWTGLVTTAANRIAETVALGRLASSEASVLLATEPLWAALFASLYIGESLGPIDAVGGALLVGACVANAIKPEALRGLMGIEDDEGQAERVPPDPEAQAAPAVESAQ